MNCSLDLLKRLEILQKKLVSNVVNDSLLNRVGVGEAFKKGVESPFQGLYLALRRASFHQFVKLESGFNRFTHSICLEL